MARSIERMGNGIAYIRIGFGIVWLVDALLKFDPSFVANMMDIIKNADAGGPAWLDEWYNFWFTFLGSAPHFFAILVIIIECALAIGLLLGAGRRLLYVSGALFSFLIWGIAEGFGGPYVSGATDPGAGIIYVLLFALLYVCDTKFIPSRLSVDAWLQNHARWYHMLSAKRDRQ